MIILQILLTFQISADVFRPEDLKIDLREEERVLTVSAKREESSQGHSVTRQFNRSFDLPQSCQLDKVQSVFTRDGILKISAPKKAVEHKPAAVPQGKKNN